MKTRRAFAYATAVAALMSIGAVSFAQDGAVAALSTRFDVAYVSKYVWRGIPQTSEGAVQPSLTFSHSSGLSYNLWASEDIDKGEFTEHDHTLNYAWNAGKLAMNAGYIYYAFPNTSYASTSEVYASACMGGTFSPTVSINYDVDEADGFYASLGGGCACPVPWGKGTPTSLNLSARLSFSSANYNRFWFGKGKAALSDLYLSASVPITLTGKASLTPSLSYYTVLDSDLREGLDAAGLKPSNLVAAVTMSYAF